MKRVKGKGLISIVLILTIATLAAASISVRAHPSPIPYVKVYVHNPISGDNIYPIKPPGPPTFAEVWIDSPDAWYDTPQGIVGVTMSFRVDPSVVNVMSALAMPDMDFFGFADSFLGDFLEDNFYYAFSLFFTGGTIDTPGGTVTATAEIILGAGTLGKGAGSGPKPLWRYLITTNAAVPDWTTAYSALTIYDAYYTTVDGVKHPVDIVEGGHYGTPPQQFSMSYVGSLLPPGDPIGTTWHELYPSYSHMWSLDSWIDNGDTYLSASDQIDMTNETGWKYWFHVDVVTVTIHWNFKADEFSPPDPAMPGSGEPTEHTTAEFVDPFRNPIGSIWHQIYPEYSRWFVITSWTDNGDDVFSVSDQFDFEYIDEPGTLYWAHLDDVTTDIILSQKGEPEPPAVPEFPWGLGLMMAIAPAIPILYLWRTRKKEEKQ